MIRVIDYKALDLSNTEYEYYQEIIKEFGADCFIDTFESDETTGFIQLVKPPLNRPIQWGIILFLMNVMINQRLREVERITQELKKNK